MATWLRSPVHLVYTVQHPERGGMAKVILGVACPHQQNDQWAVGPDALVFLPWMCFTILTSSMMTVRFQQSQSVIDRIKKMPLALTLMPIQFSLAVGFATVTSYSLK